MKNKYGFSLIEILVVISIFAVVGVLSTRALFLTLRGAKKSESSVRVRENVNYALSVVERQIRNAQSVDCITSNATTLYYVSTEGTSSNFYCGPAGPSDTSYIASGSARLTANDISLSSCAFTCTQINSNNPPVVTLSITATDPTNASVEKGTISAQTEIVVRNY